MSDVGDPAPLLTVTDVALSRGGVPVLAGVSFVLRAGAALILRGPNGAGKTTLLRAVAGLQPVAAGTIEAAEGTVALATHADGIKGAFSVEENLAFWAGLHGAPGGAVAAAMEGFGLMRLRDRAGQHLSAGQRRRLGLARLLVAGRPVWALDEPTVSLDDEGTALVARAAAAHLRDGGAVIVATHVDTGIAGEVLDLGPHRPRRVALDPAFA